MRDRKADALLEVLKRILECNYISDLHTVIFDGKAKDSINDIPLEEYTLEEWNEAVSYVIQTKCSCETINETKDRLFMIKCQF